MEQPRTVVPFKIIVTTILFLLLLYLTWFLKDLLFSLFIGFILMSALRPLVYFLEKRKFPHHVAVITIYLSFLLFFIFIFYIIIPPIILETASLVRNIPSILRNTNLPTSWIHIETFSQYIPNVTNELFNIIRIIFSNALFIVSTLFFGFYFLLEESLILRFLTKLFHEEKAQRMHTIFEKASKRMSSWFWGELILMTVVGVLTFIGLSLIGVRYSLPLATLAGLMEVVPNIGPVFSAIPALFIGISSSSLDGFWVLALYFIVQQLENNLIVPVIMNKAVGLNPIITLIALIVGGRLGGVLGVLLAIPVYLFMETIISEVLKEKKFADILR